MLHASMASIRISARKAAIRTCWTIRAHFAAIALATTKLSSGGWERAAPPPMEERSHDD